MKLKLKMSKSKHYDDSNKLVIGKMKDKTRGVALEGLVVLKSKMYSFLDIKKQKMRTEILLEQ